MLVCVDNPEHLVEPSSIVDHVTLDVALHNLHSASSAIEYQSADCGVFWLDKRRLDRSRAGNGCWCVGETESWEAICIEKDSDEIE